MTDALRRPIQSRVTSHTAPLPKEVVVDSTYDGVIGDTLALVNTARQAFGKPALTELPDSKPGNASDCLFYRALSDIGCTSVGGGGEMVFDDNRKAHYIANLWGVDVMEDGKTVRAPRQFGQVIEAFDGNKLEQYNTSRVRSF